MQKGRWAGVVALLAALALLGSSGAASGKDQPHVKALFFGDSLISGTGATKHRHVQADTTAALLDWQPVVDGFGGTGYTTGGKRGHSYLYRLSHDGFLHTPYDVIVLEGGTNDARFGSLQHLRANALQVIDYVERRQPWARLVMVGGYAPHDLPSYGRYVEADEILQQVATDRHLQYVSQLHYASDDDSAPGTGFLFTDGYHPDDKGYAIMAHDLAKALRTST